MDKGEILRKLSEILSEILDREVELKENTVSADVEGWDSLVQMTFMLVIEQDLGVELTIEEISKFENVGKLADRIAAEKKAAH